MSDRPRFTRPVPQATGTPFGKAGSLWSSGHHTGLDFPAPTGQTVVACLGGKVTSAGASGGPYGNMVQIQHALGFDTRYAHLSSVGVKIGDTVRAGQAIGKVGATGNTTGSHLHLEVLVNGTIVDPAPYIDGSKAGPKPGAVLNNDITPTGSTGGSTGGGGSWGDESGGGEGDRAGLVEGLALGARDLTVTGLVVLAGFGLVVVGAVALASPGARRAAGKTEERAELAAQLLPQGKAAAAAKGASAAKGAGAATTTPTPKG